MTSRWARLAEACSHDSVPSFNITIMSTKGLNTWFSWSVHCQWSMSKSKDSCSNIPCNWSPRTSAECCASWRRPGVVNEAFPPTFSVQLQWISFLPFQEEIAPSGYNERQGQRNAVKSPISGRQEVFSSRDHNISCEWGIWFSIAFHDFLIHEPQHRLEGCWRFCPYVCLIIPLWVHLRHGYYAMSGTSPKNSKIQKFNNSTIEKKNISLVQLKNAAISLLNL